MRYLIQLFQVILQRACLLRLNSIWLVPCLDPAWVHLDQVLDVWIVKWRCCTFQVDSYRSPWSCRPRAPHRLLLSSPATWSHLQSAFTLWEHGHRLVHLLNPLIFICERNRFNTAVVITTIIRDERTCVGAFCLLSDEQAIVLETCQVPKFRRLHLNVRLDSLLTAINFINFELGKLNLVLFPFLQLRKVVFLRDDFKVKQRFKLFLIESFDSSVIQL
jgi:hypothetical protein